MKEKRYTIKQLLIMFCIFILFIPLMCIVLFMKTRYSELANNKIMEILESKIQQNDTVVQNLMSRMVVMSGMLSDNNDIIDYLENSQDNSEILRADALEQIEVILANNFDLPINVMIFGKGKMLKTWVGNAEAGSFSQEIQDELEQYEKQDNLVTWFYDDTGMFDFYSASEDKSLNLLRQVNMGDKEYWLIVSIELDTINDLLFGQDNIDRELYELGIEGKKEKIYFYPDGLEQDKSNVENYIERLRREAFYQVDSSFGGYGSRFISTMTVESKNIEVELNELNAVFYGCTAMIFTVFTCSLFIFIRYLTQPILRLIRAMERTKETQTYLPLYQKVNISEIASLNFWYNIMVHSINEYIQKVKSQEYEKQRLHFQMLQMQINPHFLFNTLNSIKWVCYSNNDEKAGNLIASLGKMYEISMNKGSLHLSMKEEREFILNYIALMENRYDYKVKTEFKLEENSEEVVILKFLLQPIVENIFLHGFSTYARERKIMIHSYIKNGKLMITVIDNGMGIDKSHLEELENELSKSERDVSRVGIINVNHRIQIHYGRGYGLKIRNRQDGVSGTEVKLILPVKYREAGV